MPSPSLNERKLKVTRDALVDAAVDLFATKGYEATTVEQIAAKAGVSARTFFRHFPAKQDVFFADHEADLAAFRLSLPTLAAQMSLPRAVERAFEQRRSVGTGPNIRSRRIRLLREIPSVRAVSYLAQTEYEAAIAEVLLRGWTDDRLTARSTAAAVMAVLRCAQEAMADDPHRDAAPVLEIAYRTLERGIGDKPVLVRADGMTVPQ